MARRKLLGSVGLLVACLWLGAERLALAIETADLKEQLENDLQARRPSEFAFIAKVVKLVEQDKLPRSVVDGTYLWARPKRPYPFQYFQRALRVRAGRLGIKL